LADSVGGEGATHDCVISGDDDEAKSEVTKLFEDAGFFVIDLGDLIAGGEMQQIRGPLASVNLVRLPMGN
jgi:predicted dinucleotide-binding enzyme